MKLDVGPVEAVWLTVTVITFILTVAALLDAIQDRRAVTALNGHAREIAANGIVQQEALATLIQLVLIGIVVPQLFQSNPVNLTPGVIGIMIVPVLLFLKSATRAHTRRQLIGLVASDLAATNKMAFAKLDEALAENTRITQTASDNAQVASDKADAAYREANTVNEKIASLGEDRKATTEALSETLDDTHAKTLEIHETVVHSEPKA